MSGRGGSDVDCDGLGFTFAFFLSFFLSLLLFFCFGEVGLFRECIG